jgi:hypothetical protein
MKRILLKTTIPHVDDDWHIGRFSLLLQQLESLCDDHGAPVYSVTARDRSIDADIRASGVQASWTIRWATRC